mmetsp:Transcript_14685/g.42387  ORF Transcript_14685/g.42387 Transcript_14685/m.42387 type:complete len:221 (+) Transcript_14685:556-1218(+)
MGRTASGGSRRHDVAGQASPRAVGELHVLRADGLYDSGLRGHVGRHRRGDGVRLHDHGHRGGRAQHRHGRGHRRRDQRRQGQPVSLEPVRSHRALLLPHGAGQNKRRKTQAVDRGYREVLVLHEVRPRCHEAAHRGREHPAGLARRLAVGSLLGAPRPEPLPERVHGRRQPAPALAAAARAERAPVGVCGRRAALQSARPPLRPLSRDSGHLLLRPPPPG